MSLDKREVDRRRQRNIQYQQRQRHERHVRQERRDMARKYHRNGAVAATSSCMMSMFVALYTVLFRKAGR